jgi:hypothetical protein
LLARPAWARPSTPLATSAACPLVLAAREKRSKARSGAGSIGAETSRIRGLEVGVDAKAWDCGIDRGSGALAQAVSSTRSALQVRKRIVTSFQQARGWA